MSTPTNGPREPHSLTRLIHDTIHAEQKRIAKMPAGLKVWNDEQATAWQSGMSNASRLAQGVVRHWLAARELTPGAVDLMVEAAAQAMFEDPGTPGDYTWAQMVAEDVSRADLWRQDARRVLVAAGALHPRVLSAPQDDPTGAAWMERQIERVRTTPTEDEENPPQAGPTPEQLAEALCDAMPHSGGGSRLDYDDALDAARKALAKNPFSAGTPLSDALRQMTPDASPSEAQVDAAWQSLLNTAHDVTTREDVRAALAAALEAKSRALYAPPTPAEEAFLADDTLRDALERVNAAPEARKTPKTRPGTCPSCRHQSHDGRGCLNAASDNDCACTHGAPKPPSDEQVLAALNAQVRADRRAPDLSYWGDAAVDSMRAALAAAQIAPTEMQLPLTKLSTFRLREIIESCQEVVDGRAADGVTS